MEAHFNYLETMGTDLEDPDHVDDLKPEEDEMSEVWDNYRRASSANKEAKAAAEEAAKEKAEDDARESFRDTREGLHQLITDGALESLPQLIIEGALEVYLVEELNKLASKKVLEIGSVVAKEGREAVDELVSKVEQVFDREMFFRPAAEKAAAKNEISIEEKSDGI